MKSNPYVCDEMSQHISCDVIFKNLRPKGSTVTAENEYLNNFVLRVTHLISSRFVSFQFSY